MWWWVTMSGAGGVNCLLLLLFNTKFIGWLWNSKIEYFPGTLNSTQQYSPKLRFHIWIKKKYIHHFHSGVQSINRTVREECWFAYNTKYYMKKYQPLMGKLSRRSNNFHRTLITLFSTQVTFIIFTERTCQLTPVVSKSVISKK